MDVVVVESPTKAKTINKYLGDRYRVLPSYGHVRDLPEKDGSVLPEEDFRVLYELLPEKKKRVDEIAAALKDGASRLILATDPDREGEAISWHLLELLQQKKALKAIDVERVVFHEVTKPAVLDAMRHGRELDQNLIDAYQARRALDYLVGFRLSPVLWRKLPKSGSSAGRVQSVALRLICEREAEILAFRAQEYWTVEALLESPEGRAFKARLTQLDGKRLDKFALRDEAAARRAVREIEARALAVDHVEKKQVGRNPAPPFSTSTLQQEASRKLGFSADRTMKTAQRLFEGVELAGETVGLITYMRTDSVQLSGEALSASRRLIGERFGEDYLPEKPRQFKTKTKNAQEAHEAIRPTDLFRAPADLRGQLDDDQRRLYELIWKRTVASQMAAALLDRVVVDVSSADGAVSLRATGQTIAFDGFLKLYQEGRDDPAAEEDEDGAILPPLAVGDATAQRSVTPLQHFTEPPPRYSEASLVKKLEELGIGRPSTYASIISVLQSRSYVRIEQKRFVPEDKGWLVSAFLVEKFGHWVEYDFTAQLENQLDDVAGGSRRWKDVLRQFWEPFAARLAEVGEQRQREVIDALDHALGPLMFKGEGETDPRMCPRCQEGRLGLKLSGFGPFIGCSRYPDCGYTRAFTIGGKGAAEEEGSGDRLLGNDPGTAEEVWLKIGRFGPYVQRGSGAEAKRSSLPPGTGPAEVDLELALKLLALPREIGTDPESSKPVIAGINRYGPFIQLDGRYVRLEQGDDVFSLGMNRALALLAEPPKGRRAAAAAGPLREVGQHPADQQPITLHSGRFGPYVKHGKLNASLPKRLAPETLTVEDAVKLLAERAAKVAEGGGRPKPAARGKAAAKPAAKAAKPAAKAKPKAAKAEATPKAARPRKSAEG
ncbi:MAG: type I DNA topoisomerase [Geminicoccaceae bacterium]